ncbi:uncharacterized protein LOC102806258 [Saccoglossus kowalevskii]|uniref:Homeobox protein ceh-8-like n=1 Tax=Saccoglossus kowalevskii TaxID=10224 RepID=A0ABM0MS39_SACKO|nr:PREDICTED: homeobox protein ceh-8-like [Saccoglossus kowalevskii]
MADSIQDSQSRSTPLCTVSPGSSSRCSTPSSATSSLISPLPSASDNDDCSRDGSPSLSNSSSSLNGDSKRKRINKTSRARRTSFYAYQLTGLTQVFDQEQYPDPAQRQKIADALELDFDTITRWFQNRRAKYRRDRNNVVAVKEEPVHESVMPVEEKEQGTTTPPPPPVASTVSSFAMDSILQPSPPSRPHSISKESYAEDADPPAPGVNSYYEYHPYYYPAYMYHYYPVVPAHSQGMVSPKTRGPNSGPPEQPLDLSCSEKKRKCDDKENAEPASKRRKVVEDCKSDFTPTKTEIAPAIKYGPPQETSKRDSMYYSKLRSMYNPSPYYNPVAYNYGKYQDIVRHDLATPGFVPMTSTPVHSLEYGRPYGYQY